MKKRRNYGRKIKHNKLNLYPKKKTKAQKILSIVLMVIVLLAIAFFGYCLGKPLLDYFENNLVKDEYEWTPPADKTEQTTTQPVETTIPETEPTTAMTEEPVQVESIYAVTVPASALANSSALSAYAAKSSAEGFTAAVVQLKDSNGNLRYASELEILKDSEVVTGTLSAKEISSVLRKNGLVPVASIATLTDNLGCKAIPDMSYKIIDEEGVSWLDYKNGTPVRWANPESKATTDYINAVVSELKAGGFEGIVQTNIIFPDFQDYDREYIAPKYFETNRSKLLTGVIAEDAYIEINAREVLNGRTTGTAELLRNKGIKNKILLRINRSEFNAENGYPVSAGSLVEVIMSEAEAKYGSFEFLPLINGKDFQTEEIAAIRETLDKMGYKEFFIG